MSDLPIFLNSAARPWTRSRANLPRSPRVSEDEDTCWICLESSGELSQPCSCPRFCHQKCMARWQLQQAGRTEEKYCRFCAQELPDWKSTFLGNGEHHGGIIGNGQHVVPAEVVDPVMVVTLGDKVHRIKVKLGEEGRKEFQLKVRALFNIPDGVDFEVTFRCKAPATGGASTADTIQLEGMNSYSAATHCASVMAAQRVASNNTKGAFRRNGNDIVDCPM
eukprot:gene1297-32646_t